MRIVVKVGTCTLAHPTGRLNIQRMEKLCKVLSDLKNMGHEIILVSSGAIAMGFGKLNLSERPKDVPTKQASAAVGQCELMYIYDKLFTEYNHTVAQLLITAPDIEEGGVRKQNFHNTLARLLELGALPVINENDTISVTELMFTDNDELSGLIATMMGMDALVILSNIDGIYNGNPSDPDSSVIREIECGKTDLSEYVQTSKSSFGRGGMLTKCHIAQKVADEAIAVSIANGKKDNILPMLLAVDSDTVCTRFIPASKPVSSVKKWIAHSEGFAKGEIHINKGAEEALPAPKATSVLLVGVTRIEGDFEKDDIVKIMNEEGVQIGVGCTAYDSEEARKQIGQRDLKPLIHYDYLYLD